MGYNRTTAKTQAHARARDIQATRLTRYDRISRGLCTYCGKEKPRPGMKTGENCAALDRARKSMCKPAKVLVVPEYKTPEPSVWDVLDQQETGLERAIREAEADLEQVPA